MEVIMRCPYNLEIEKCHNDDNHCYCCDESPKGKEYNDRIREEIEKYTKNMVASLINILDNHVGGEVVVIIDEGGTKVPYVINDEIFKAKRRTDLKIKLEGGVTYEL